MSKPISIKKWKEQIINSNESLERALRVLPHMIQQEIEAPHINGTSPRVIKDLQKRLDVAREIMAIRVLSGNA